MSGITVSITPLEQHQSVQAEWRSLESDCDCSMFISSFWIAAWLRQLPPIDLLLVRILEQNLLVGLGILVPRSVTRHRLIKSRQLTLNESGNPERDYCIEYNGLLIRRGYEKSAFNAFLGYLYTNYSCWDEICFPGVSVNQVSESVIPVGSRWRLLPYRQGRSRCFYVDLNQLREQGKDYPSTLSRGRRQRVRRAIRAWEELGPVSLSVAKNEQQARLAFSELLELHLRYWRGKSQTSSCENPAWQKFHRDLIKMTFPEGWIQMITIKAGDTPVGYLYNLLYRGRVMFIQSGFNYQLGKSYLPGFVSHWLAIQYNLDLGHTEYDFLAGEDAYKGSLARKSRELAWLKVQKPRYRFRAEAIARRLWRATSPGMPVDINGLR